MEAIQQSQWNESDPLPRATRVSAHSVLGLVLGWIFPLAAGLAMRLVMLKHLYQVSVDSEIYGALARAILDGGYGVDVVGTTISPTLIRLPGYPLYLALCFRLFGLENYFAATLPQIALELLGCLLLADFAACIAPPNLKRGARVATLWLAALCPFTSSYTAVPLTESLTLFAIALALWAMARIVQHPRWATALTFTFAVTFAAMLRPDGVLVGASLVPALLVAIFFNRTESRAPTRRLVPITIVCALLATAPFAAWTLRNWRDFHVFEPLAPRYATDPGQDVFPGWQRWIKTWCLDFACTYNVYWEVPGDPLVLSRLPPRAFDSPAQYAETAAIAADYNNRDSANYIAPDVDQRLGVLAEQRIRSHPVRYYVWLPLGRVADMWLRPRVENLNIDLDWWAYHRHRAETRFSWAYVALNALYLLLASVGFWLKSRFRFAILAYLLLRSAMLLTVEAPEARYTLEAFPMLFALSGVGLYWLVNCVCLSVVKVKASDGSR